MKENRNSYVYGNTARNIDLKTAVYEEPTHSTLKELRAEKKKHKKMHMGFVYVAFLGLAIFVFGSSVVSYVRLQAEISTTIDINSGLETELNNLTVANDDEYSNIVNDVDLNEIRRIAVEELGMVYVTPDQIVTYEREKSDYVRQFTDIPN